MHPCPACGFLVDDEGLYSFNICQICGWENDLVQYRLPELTGGANRMSLMAAQAEVLRRLPIGTDQVDGVRRALGWRPVDSSDLESREDNFGWSVPVRGLRVSSEQRYYWELQ